MQDNIRSSESPCRVVSVALVATRTRVTFAPRRKIPDGVVCLLLAISRSSRGRARSSASPAAADIRAPKSAFALISSGVPPGADSQGGGAVGPEVTRSGHPDGVENALQTMGNSAGFRGTVLYRIVCPNDG